MRRSRQRLQAAVPALPQYQTAFYATYATRFADVADLGKVLPEKMPSGKFRYRIVINKRGRKHYLGTQRFGEVDLPFGSEEHALGVLEQIRACVANGDSVQQAIARFQPTQCPENLVESRMAEYLEHLAALTKQNDRSLNDEVPRYARPTKAGVPNGEREFGSGTSGAFSWWYRHQISDITPRDIQLWHHWLAKRENTSTRTKNKTLPSRARREKTSLIRSDDSSTRCKSGR